MRPPPQTRPRRILQLIARTSNTVITHHFPIIGTPYWTVDTNYTSNPCHQNNGLEAAIEYTVVLTGDKVTIYGNDIHKLGATAI